MRRGLMGWNEEELPVAALHQRAERLRAAMQGGGLDALVLYTNLVRPSAVYYLNGLTPYWSEGLLLLGRSGEPVFATALSKRVAKWMRSVSPVGEIANTPRPGTLIGQRIAADKAKRVGILEFDDLPAGAYDDLAAAAPGLELVDATALFAQARRHIDPAERRLLARTDAIATTALAEVDAAADADAGSVAGLVEKRARLDGAEEAYIMVAPDLAADRRMIRASPVLPLGAVFAVRASIAYKGVWVRRTRTYARDAAAQQTISGADAWFAQTPSSIAAGRALAEQIAAGVKRLPKAEMKSWMAESCRGTNPLQAIAGTRSPGSASVVDGDYLVVSLDLTIAGTPWLGAVPMVVGGAGAM